MIVVAQHVPDMQLNPMQRLFAPQTMTDLVSNITAPMTDVEEALFNQRGMKEVQLFFQYKITTHIQFSGSLSRSGSKWKSGL